MGRALTPYDPTVSFVAGVLSAREGDAKESQENFRRCVRLDPEFAPEVVDVYVRQVNRPDLAVAVAAGNPDWLLLVADALNVKPDAQALAGDFDQAGWHLSLAEALAQTRQVAQAIREAQICLRLAPDTPAAVEQIRSWSTLPGAAPE